MVSVLDGDADVDPFGGFADLSPGSADATDFGQSINDALQAWLTSDSDAQVAELINAPFVYLFGRDLIGNGIDDFTDANTSLLGSSGMFGDLGDGGFLFGNGGAGGNGGYAGVRGPDSPGGNGGAGGQGGAGSISGDSGEKGTDGNTPGSRGGGGDGCVPNPGSGTGCGGGGS